MPASSLRDIFYNSKSNFLLEVQMGIIPGAKIHQVSGLCDNPNTTELTDVWNVQGNTVFLSTAQNLFVFSTSTTDNSTKHVYIEGLDAEWKTISEVVALNGTTSVQTVNSYIRVNFLKNANGLSLTGTVYVSKVQGSTLASNVVRLVEPKYQRCLCPMYSIPDDYNAFLINGHASVIGGKDAEFVFYYSEYNKTPIAVEMFFLYGSHIESLRPYNLITSRSDLNLKAISASNNSRIEANYFLLLLDKKYFDINI